MDAKYTMELAGHQILFPIKAVLLSLMTGIDILEQSILTTAWDYMHVGDNLATMTPPQLTPSSKYVAIRYHWFHD
jgi:hypothetical protein